MDLAGGTQGGTWRGKIQGLPCSGRGGMIGEISRAGSGRNLIGMHESTGARAVAERI